MARKPGSVRLDGKALDESNDINHPGYQWLPLNQGGLLRVHRMQGVAVTVLN
jgi:hypothetical protein